MRFTDLTSKGMVNAFTHVCISNRFLTALFRECSLGLPEDIFQYERLPGEAGLPPSEPLWGSRPARLGGGGGGPQQLFSLLKGHPYDTSPPLCPSVLGVSATLTVH